MEESFNIVFVILMVMVFVWFGMIIYFDRRLKTKHPVKFKEMGEPHLFWNNSMKTTWTTMKFLFLREHKTLNDKTLSFLSDFMLVFLLFYTVVFFGVFLGYISNVPTKI
jgi:hypothetical protein